MFITRYDSNSSPLEDFVITNGVLEDYMGPGGDVVIPRKVKKIDNNAFGDCSGLTEVVIPEGVKIIDRSAFSDLEKITISKSVTEIGDHAFLGCKNLIIYGYNGSYIKRYVGGKTYIRFRYLE